MRVRACVLEREGGPKKECTCWRETERSQMNLLLTRQANQEMDNETFQDNYVLIIFFHSY